MTGSIALGFRGVGVPLFATSLQASVRPELTPEQVEAAPDYVGARLS